MSEKAWTNGMGYLVQGVQSLAACADWMEYVSPEDHPNAAELSKLIDGFTKATTSLLEEEAEAKNPELFKLFKKVYKDLGY